MNWSAPEVKKEKAFVLSDKINYFPGMQDGTFELYLKFQQDKSY